MDSRAKQRLTGAVILVALFVLLVPELLTGPKDAALAPATAEEEGLRRYTIDLNAPTTPAGAPREESTVTLPPVAASPMSADGGRAQPGEAATPPADPTPAEPAHTPPPAAANPVNPPAPAQVTPGTAVAASPAPATKPPATPTPAPRETRKPTDSAGGRFVVQLGSFGSRDNAERLVRDMTAKGFTTFIAPITTNGRELYRVRVGPAKDRAAAEALAAQLKRMGQSGSIVPIP
jgi:DedD protein